MSKVLITTCYCAHNHGAFWQAYSLWRYIESLGYEVHFYPLAESLFVSAAEDGYIEATEAKLSKVRTGFPLAQPGEHFAVAVLGSDEIWNLSNPMFRDMGIFWGQGLPADKVISYAPSMGGAGRRNVLKNLRRMLALRKLSAISVRDANTERNISWCLPKRLKPVRVLDPVFLHDFADIAIPEGKEPFVFCYTYGFSVEKISAVQRFARSRGLKIVATGSQCSWADENPVLSPKEWAGFIKAASYVVTSTFHGTVFSVVMRKDFSVIPNSPKILSLLAELKLEKRIMSDEVLPSAVNYKAVEPVLQEKMAASRTYLQDALKRWGA